MVELSYYPGCTLKTKAKAFEESALVAMAALGMPLRELDRWNCCGTVHTLAEDDLVHYLAPARNLIRVKENDVRKVVTLCSFCYHTLKRTSLLMAQDVVKRDTMNKFMEEEPDYDAEIRVLHLLEVLRDDIGWERIKSKVSVPLTGLKVAGYYGCTLLRPKDLAIDDSERPTIMNTLMETLGAEPVDFPFAAECCGSYNITSNPESVVGRTREILSSAMRRGAEVMVVTCPLCHYNLNQQRQELRQQDSDFTNIPILYFTQLLALSLGIDSKVCHLDPVPEALSRFAR